MLLSGCPNRTASPYGASRPGRVPTRSRQTIPPVAAPSDVRVPIKAHRLVTPSPALDGGMLFLAHTNPPELRYRVFSISDEEFVLWRGRWIRWPTASFPDIYYMLSPDRRRVAVSWRWAHFPLRTWVVQIPVGDSAEVLQQRIAAPEEIPCPKDTKFVWWHSNDELSMLSVPASSRHDDLYGPWGVECVHDLRTGEQEFVRRHAYALDCLKRSFQGPIEVVERIAKADQLPALDDLARDRAGSRARAVLRGVGLPPFFPLRTTPRPRGAILALSPDQRHLALAPPRNQELLVYSLHDSRASLRQSISLTRLAEKDAVWVEDLRWSSDSQCLTFTEGHYLPVRPDAYLGPWGLAGPDIPGQQPIHQDFSYLVRLCAVQDGQLSTIAAGRNASLLPPVPATDP
jgi:hypothetical protein